MRSSVSSKSALNKGLLCATSASLVLALFIAPARAQLRSEGDGNNAAAVAAANPAGVPSAAPQVAQRLIQHITVSGTQRVENATVLTYIGLREGDPYIPSQIDDALKALYATGLFSDVKINFEPSTATLTIRVVENPIINQVVFEGNSKITDKDLTKEVERSSPAPSSPAPRCRRMCSASSSCTAGRANSLPEWTRKSSSGRRIAST